MIIYSLHKVLQYQWHIQVHALNFDRKLVTIKIEDAVEDVDKIDFMSSNSTEGQSTVFVRFEEMSDTDFKFILQDVRSAVDSIDDFPEEAEDPIVLEMATGEMVPVSFVTLSGNLPERELKEIADDMKDRFLEMTIATEEA